jgi:hypothetical protein
VGERLPSKKERMSKLDFEGSAETDEVPEDHWDDEEPWDDEVETMMGRPQQKLQYAVEEADRLKEELQQCKKHTQEDPAAPLMKARAEAPDLLSGAPPLWSEGLAFHQKLRVNTLMEYSHTRSQYKKLVQDRVKTYADKFNVKMFQVLAFEECAEWCDTWQFCGDPPCNVRKELDTALLGSYAEPHGSWSSCFSGCNMGFLHDPNGTSIRSCQRACEGQAIESYFCTTVGCEHWQTSVLDLTPGKKSRMRASRKRLSSKTSSNSEAAEQEVDLIEDELRATEKKIENLRAKLVPCRAGDNP